MFNFGWWRDEDNRDGASAIVDVLKVAVPAVVMVAGGVAAYFWDGGTAPDAPKPTVNIETGDGSPVVIGDGNKTTIKTDD